MVPINIFPNKKNIKKDFFFNFIFYIYKSGYFMLESIENSWTDEI